MEHKELEDYLAIAQPEDLHQLAFKYAYLLALVVEELVKRANQDSAITKAWMEKHCGNTKNNS